MYVIKYISNELSDIDINIFSCSCICFLSDDSTDNMVE